MAAIFDSEIWKIQRMYEARDFAGMSNVVDIQPDATGNRQNVFVAVPTDLFKYVREVMKAEDLSKLHLYLDHLEGDKYVFGIADDYGYHDLWVYSRMPQWAVTS
jgi:hypothetical protein